jgi:hypothetical protein
MHTGYVVADLIDRVLQLLDELVDADILRLLCCAKAFACIARQCLEDGQVLAEVLG